MSDVCGPEENAGHDTESSIARAGQRWSAHHPMGPACVILTRHFGTYTGVQTSVTAPVITSYDRRVNGEPG